jgi:hypothetical protein
MRSLIMLAILCGPLAAEDPGLPATLDAVRQRTLAAVQQVGGGHEDEALAALIGTEWYVTADRAKDLQSFTRYLGPDGDLRKIYGAPKGAVYIGTSYLTDLDAVIAYGVVYDNGLLPVVFGVFKTPAGYKLNQMKIGQSATVDLLPFQKVEGG